MSKKEKALKKLHQNPKNVRFEEIEAILIRLGFVKRQQGTSHAVFTFENHRLVIPCQRPFVKAVYVALLLEELEKIDELEVSDEN